MLRLKTERMRLRKSQSEIARLTGMHVTTISQIENGHLNPYPGQVTKLVAALEWAQDPKGLFEEVEEDD